MKLVSDDFRKGLTKLAPIVLIGVQTYLAMRSLHDEGYSMEKLAIGATFMFFMSWMLSEAWEKQLALVKHNHWGRSGALGLLMATHALVEVYMVHGGLVWYFLGMPDAILWCVSIGMTCSNVLAKWCYLSVVQRSSTTKKSSKSKKSSTKPSKASCSTSGIKSQVLVS